MSSIFLNTIGRAISDYRQLLRRHLPQAERVNKLKEFNLKDRSLYENENRLYQTAWAIVRDIENNMCSGEGGYYSYSGIAQFARYLKEFLRNYEIEGDQVTHKAQKASRALVYVIQLFSIPDEKLDDKVTSEFKDCNTIVASHGTEEQQELYENYLVNYRERNSGFYTPILLDFQARVQRFRQEELLAEQLQTQKAMAEAEDATVEDAA